MNETTFRSPLLMNADDSALLVIDVQEKLLPHVFKHRRIEWNIGRLIQGANTLGVHVCATEQYPQGLGKTSKLVAKRLAEANISQIPSKTMFSCRECQSLMAELKSKGISNLVLAGIETHVCVAQTALDALADGFNVFLCVDATGSRFEVDCTVATRRLEASGATLTTTEATLFEWCEKAGSPEFKTISKIVQETGPGDERWFRME